LTKSTWSVKFKPVSASSEVYDGEFKDN